MGDEVKHMETAMDTEMDAIVAPLKPEIEPGRSVAISDQAPASLLNFIAQAVTDPNIDVTKLETLLKMKREVEADEAKREFIAAFGRLSAVLPRIKKDGSIDLGKGKPIPFARWEDIDEIIRPLMAAEGFTLSFNSTPRAETGGGLVVEATLMHRDGHTRTASMALPLDTGPGRNNLQAVGSTLSYGKRYTAEMVLNIVRQGADDDGKRGGMKFITKDQATEIDGLLTKTNSDRLRFLQLFEIAEIENLPLDSFPAARNMLLLKVKQ